VEDLGNINITIREAVGGRGGSGNVGGGPGPGLNPSQREIAEAIASVEASQKQAMAAVQTAQQQIKQPPVQGLRMFDPILRRQEVTAELLNFIRRPSFAGATGLLREGMATRTMLQGLGKSGVGLASGLLAVGAVAGGVALALGAFKMAADNVASRIEETWRYSVQQAGAMAEQQVTKIGLLAQEAAQNGKLYADVIRAQTDVEIARAKITMRLGEITARLTVQFSKFLERFFDFADKYLNKAQMASDIATRLSEYSPIVMGYRLAERNLYDIEGSGLNFFEAMHLTLLRMVGMEEAANEAQNEYMDEIARNTRKDAMSVANEWFQADIQYLTGQRF
jgi:hypothetical protein